MFMEICKCVVMADIQNEENKPGNLLYQKKIRASSISRGY
jgi:hypothetical protein